MRIEFEGQTYLLCFEHRRRFRKRRSRKDAKLLIDVLQRHETVVTIKVSTGAADADGRPIYEPIASAQVRWHPGDPFDRGLGRRFALTELFRPYLHHGWNHTPPMTDRAFRTAVWKTYWAHVKDFERRLPEPPNLRELVTAWFTELAKPCPHEPTTDPVCSSCYAAADTFENAVRAAIDAPITPRQIRLRTLLDAVVARLEAGHHASCLKSVSSDPNIDCECGHDALLLAVRPYRRIDLATTSNAA